MIEYRAKQDEGDISRALSASPIASYQPVATRTATADGPPPNEPPTISEARSYHSGSSRGNQHQQVDYETVRRRCDRWHAAESRLQTIEATGKPKPLSQVIEVLLTDEQRPGAPATFTFEQFMENDSANEECSTSVRVCLTNQWSKMSGDAMTQLPRRQRSTSCSEPRPDDGSSRIRLVSHACAYQGSATIDGDTAIDRGEYTGTKKQWSH